MPKDQNVLEMSLTPVLARRILKEIVEADDGRVFFRLHAEQRMVQRGITRSQVYRCLRCGRFVEEPYRSDRHGNWEMKLEVISAGDVVTVAAALD